MKVEIRADGLHISGYVNVTEKMSRPVITGKGKKVIEVIEPRAFEKALERVDNVTMTKDHESFILAETRSGSLTLYEDAIGLHADAMVTDEQTIEEARAGKLKGWSFGMKNIVDNIEERADSIPLRRISGLDLDHITLVVNKTPFYAATSIEMRADDQTDEIESRAFEDPVKIVECETKSATPLFDNSAYKARINEIKK
ncbi:HK97 family phage prohead protease [Dehalobacter sp. DCM]|uniref:HK97 family phage prohead protease n=1 Tax=Dehalobacter sp. DCM TaxID=2907827 RepID=UPI0030816CFE|nr:HK97 family phage prohead protease [Dehalobacter sp. DCM]